MSSRKWCAKFDHDWKGESGMEPGGTKVKGASTVVSGKCVLSLLLPLNEKRKKDISQE